MSVVTFTLIEGRPCKQLFVYTWAPGCCFDEDARMRVPHTERSAGLIPRRGWLSPQWPKSRNISLRDQARAVLHAFQQTTVGYGVSRAEIYRQLLPALIWRKAGAEGRRRGRAASRFPGRLTGWPSSTERTRRKPRLGAGSRPSGRLCSLHSRVSSSSGKRASAR